jgi:hypothetical protein
MGKETIRPVPTAPELSYDLSGARSISNEHKSIPTDGKDGEFHYSKE